MGSRFRGNDAGEMAEKALTDSHLQTRPLTRDLREIRDQVHGVAEAGQKVQPVGADRGVGIVDQHRLEEGVDGAAEGGQRCDGALVVVGGVRR